MKLSIASIVLLGASLVSSTPLTTRKLVLRNGATCAVDGGKGTCMSVSEGCAGGVFHDAKGGCPSLDSSETQCCILSTGATQALRERSGTMPRAAATTPSGNLPGLNSVQSGHARAIIGEVQSAGVGKQGCLAAFATALVESSVYEYANKAVPASLNYPYDKIGSDHDSIGIFQQRASIYTNIAADMDPAQSAGQFFKVMEGISGWQTMDVGTLCQKVQKSAYPTRYSAQVGAAEKICAAGGIS